VRTLRLPPSMLKLKMSSLGHLIGIVAAGACAISPAVRVVTTPAGCQLRAERVHAEHVRASAGRATQLGHFSHWARSDRKAVGSIRPISVLGIKTLFPFVF
jgi:hypothetical protein